MGRNFVSESAARCFRAVRVGVSGVPPMWKEMGMPYPAANRSRNAQLLIVDQYQSAAIDLIRNPYSSKQRLIAPCLCWPARIGPPKPSSRRGMTLTASYNARFRDRGSCRKAAQPHQRLSTPARPLAYGSSAVMARASTWARMGSRAKIGEVSAPRVSFGGAVATPRIRTRPRHKG